MTNYSMILIPEQEQARKERKQALDSLKYNTMCYGCKKFLNGCEGTVTKVWDGCIYKEDNCVKIYALAAYVPELIKNEDIRTFDEFLEELRNNRVELVKYIYGRARGEHFKDEVLTEKYIDTCKKILKILGEEVPTDKKEA